MTPQGIFILKTSKENLIVLIDSLCHKYNQRTFNIGVFKKYCWEVKALFESCFLDETVGYRNCHKQVTQYYHSHHIDQKFIDSAKFDIFDTLIRLKNMADSAIYLKDLPSCKKLTELSEEDLIAEMKDLVNSKIVKAGIGTMLLTKDMNDAVTIFDVTDFYDRLAKEIISSISINQEQPSPIELALLRKCKEELNYCSIAMKKTGNGALKEINGLAKLLNEDNGTTHGDIKWQLCGHNAMQKVSL